MSSVNQLNTGIVSVKDLLGNDSLQIPDYQRPYKWGVKNVSQLLNDIILHKDKSAYRIGTIVFHKDQKQNELNIVDGQQRSITLLLIALAIEESSQVNEVATTEKYPLVSPDLFSKTRFSNPVTQQNIKANYGEIRRRVKEFDFDTLRFFYERCQLVKVELSDISEAFQFFDSQNARGKDLYPHDLLKAFHLREMAVTTTEQERTKIVENWEDLDQDTLKQLFQKYLYRVRNWSKGYPARFFSKSKVDVFKGISPEITETFPFASIYRIANFYVDGYNADINRKIDLNQMPFPFQLDQTMINGKRFFEFIAYYKQKIDEVKENFIKHKIIRILNAYDGRNRTGDKYVRTLFDCCLLFYLDKFGEAEIDRAIEKFFIWAYTVRVEHFNVQLATIDNYALGEPFLFKRIKEATHPNQVLSVPISAPYRILDNAKTKPIVKLFKKFGYEQ
ncbi:DUF262 domain-containing protein [Constantimarinum furrinae]|uniref:Uncharacterized protein n=1 Tax=Constantimarinum furrinae TaxID=2562285 RepID=A0A7G8PRS7_9FLAO|nr:DUF262 domain-containing protein [Constantimarinum furrinae]QNJ97043.1 hypothetical protein ALE3EI_0460 [Constantimarinum furrinae]